MRLSPSRTCMFFAAAIFGAIPAGISAQNIDEAFAGSAVSDDTLKTMAGREDLSMIARSDQTAAVSKNSVGDNAVTGEVRIADNAFQNLSGLSLLNVNTGNNVAINASMNVNISINPVP